MGLLKSVGTICMQNLRKWKTDYRIWVIGIVTIVMVWIYVDDINRVVANIGTDMPIWIFPFIFSQFHMKLVFTLPVILLFCNAPFIDSNQNFVYIRSGRNRWLLGQLLYVTAASGIYYLFLIVVCLLSSAAAGGEMSLQWGKAITTIAGTGLAGYYGSPYVVFSNITITYFTPLSAVWFTFILSWLCGTMLGVIIFFCNLATGTKFVGITVTALLIVLSALVDTGYPQVLYFSPVSWITLDQVDVGGLTKNPTFIYCISFYLIATALFIAGILIFGKKQSMDVRGQ